MTKDGAYPAGTCHIYLVAHRRGDALVAPVKIGITASLRSRLAALQTGNPSPIEIVATFATPSHDMAAYFERSFHEIHVAERLTGEWFDIPPRDALVSLMVYVSEGLRLNLSGAEPGLLTLALRRAGVDAAIDLLNDWPRDDEEKQ